MEEKKERFQYTREFKQEAVELEKAHHGPVAEVARDLGIWPNLLYRKIKEYEQDGLYAFPGLGKRKEPEAELLVTEAKMAVAEAEKDLLRK